MRWVAIAAVVVLLLLTVGTVAVVMRGAPPSFDSANDMVDSWIAQMAGPSGDRGWSLLSTEAQQMSYQGDAEGYWADLEESPSTRAAFSPWSTPRRPLATQRPPSTSHATGADW